MQGQGVAPGPSQFTSNKYYHAWKASMFVWNDVAPTIYQLAMVRCSCKEAGIARGSNSKLTPTNTLQDVPFLSVFFSSSLVVVMSGDNVYSLVLV